MDTLVPKLQPISNKLSNKCNAAADTAKNNNYNNNNKNVNRSETNTVPGGSCNTNMNFSNVEFRNEKHFDYNTNYNYSYNSFNSRYQKINNFERGQRYRENFNFRQYNSHQDSSRASRETNRYESRYSSPRWNRDSSNSHHRYRDKSRDKNYSNHNKSVALKEEQKDAQKDAQDDKQATEETKREKGENSKSSTNIAIKDLNNAHPVKARTPERTLQPTIKKNSSVTEKATVTKTNALCTANEDKVTSKSTDKTNAPCTANKDKLTLKFTDKTNAPCTANEDKVTWKSPVKKPIEEASVETTETPTTEETFPRDNCSTANAGDDNNDKQFPKISIIPLSRLIRDELLNLSEDENVNVVVSNSSCSTSTTKRITSSSITSAFELRGTGATPTKRYSTAPNLVSRTRKISTCSNSSNTTETLCEKVASMDKTNIMNVINSSGTKFDEALKLQARKRLREEIHKQLKSLNLEQPKSGAHSDFMPDHIVESIQIPDVILDEIRKAFGIGIETFERGVAPDTTAKTTMGETSATVSKENYSPSKSNNNDLMSRLKTSEQMKAHLESSRNNSPVRHRTNSKSSQHSPRQLLKKQSLSPTPPQSRVGKKRKTKKLSKTKRDSKKRHKNKNSKDVIVIDSSSSCTSSSSSCSQSSSSTSSSDDDDDSASSVSDSSLKRRRLKLRIGADNVVDSFEKLILPNLPEDLVKRYGLKYSISTQSKLHFISCICTSDYNSKKFMKIEIAKIQRNLKSEDNAMALDFLMREIVNVLSKQKLMAKESRETKLEKSQINQMSIIPSSSEVEPHRIGVDSASAEGVINTIQITTQLNEEEEEEAEEQELIEKNFNKNANAAEKVIAEQIRKKRKLEKINKSKSQSPKQSTVSAKAATLPHTTKVVENQHQSVNKQTPVKRGGDGGSAVKASKKSADNASSHTHGSATKKGKTIEKKQNSNETANCIRDGKEQSYYDKSNKNNQFDERNDNSINGKQLSSEEEREEVVEHEAVVKRQWKSPGEKKILDLIEMSSSSNLDVDAIIKIYNNGINCSSNSNFADNLPSAKSPSLLELPNFPPVDLDALKQQSLLGEAVVSNLREIDVKLMELHKRKMFFEEMILKLQQDKLETDLQTMKLQNEKFMLLNTAMTANATAMAARNMEKSLKNNAKIATEVVRENRKKTKTSAVGAQKRKATKLDEENTCCRPKRQYRKWAFNYNKNSKHAKASSGDKTEVETTATIVVDAIAPAVMHSSEEMDINRNKNTTSMGSDDESTNSTTTDYSNISCGSVEGIKSPLTQIRIFEDYIIASSEDGNLYKFNIKTLQLEEHFAKHSEAITQMYICRLKKLIYTTSLDGYLKKTSIENFELDIQSLYLQEPLQSIEVKWGVAFIGSRWGNIFTYDIATSKIAESMLCSTDASIIAIKAVKEGARKIIIVSSKGNLIHLRDARTGLLLRTLDVPEHVHIYSLLLDDGAIYCGTQKKEIYKYDFTTGTHLATLVCGNGAVSLKLFKHKYLLVGCYDGYIYVLDKETSEQIDCFPGSGKMVLTMEIAGNKLITSAKDKTMKITDIPEHIVTKTLKL